MLKATDVGIRKWCLATGAVEQLCPSGCVDMKPARSGLPSSSATIASSVLHVHQHLHPSPDVGVGMGGLLAVVYESTSLMVTDPVQLLWAAIGSDRCVGQVGVLFNY